MASYFLLVRSQQIPVLLLWLLLFVVELLVSLYFCDGRLVFTLDDPYIHLAVGDHILSGGYGVNGSEFSSPSSSIIWPYLMALTEALHLGALGPLLVNAIAACASVFAFLRFVDAIGLFDHKRERLFSYAVAILGIFVTSAIALPMTGMEHSLHVWATIVTFTGLVGAARGQSPAIIHFLALVLLPLVRFEGLAFAFAAIGGFALLGRVRLAAAAAVLIFCALGGYLALMASRGLPLLPSSVLLKSHIAETAYEHTSVFGSISNNLLDSLHSPSGILLILLGIAIAWGAWLMRADRKAFIVCATVLAAVGAHVGFGQYGWFHRYEVYIIALATLMLLYVAAQAGPLPGGQRRSAVTIGVAVLMALASVRYVYAAVATPIAARHIYDQQYQMGIFARKLYNHPVAVNDLGLVAYKNPNFVLDLWGLGSEKVRRAKLAGQYGAEQMAALADEYHVGLAMIYDNWYIGIVPPTWKKVAVLRTTRTNASSGDGAFFKTVAFYMTPSADAEEVWKALDAFKSALPSRDGLEIMK